MSCPLHRHLLWTALTNCSSTGIYSQNVTSSSGPTHVPVRDLRQPGFLCMANHSNLFCMGGHGSQVSCAGCRPCGTRVCLPAWWRSLTFLLVTCTVLCGTMYNVTSQTIYSKNLPGMWQLAAPSPVSAC